MTSNGGFIETTGNDTVKFSFSTQSNGLFEIWLHALYAPVTTGNLSFVLDNQNINLTIQPYSKVFEGFDWIKVGSFDLTTGTHTLEILNANGYNAISDFGIVPQVYMEQATQNLSQVLENKQLLYIFNTSNHYVKMFTTEINSSSLTKWKAF